jgi:cyanophycinase
MAGQIFLCSTLIMRRSFGRSFDQKSTYAITSQIYELISRRERKKMNSSQTWGKLIIIGGAENKENDCIILREFVRCAGGSMARIVVLTAASSDPQEVGQNYVRIFNRIGVEDVQVFHTRERGDVDNNQGLDLIEQATGVFFTGGDQARIVDMIKGTKLDTLIHNRYAEGMVVGVPVPEPL